ncbi:CDP-alcohol phosphatidyltransferase family protein [Pistricoccus aurantiacus]|uniref:CDP-alcohol phosphatidyltransferase family protein n=1 Tax=Pistricoccus aurantiacus TaxID=1883414 RepID=UPI0036392CCD
MTRASHSFRTLHPAIWGELAIGLIVTTALAGALGWLTGRSYFSLGTFVAYAAIALTVAAFWPKHQASLGWANRITLLRGSLIAVILGHLIYQESLAREGLILAGVALAALLLDGVDGWIARRTASCSRFGWRFDMELDALLILTLCTASAALGKVGPWVLMIGLMRYGFVAAGHFLPWLKRELPDSLRRKTICVVQVVVLLLALLPFIGTAWASGLSALALGLLGLSFGMDIRWLFHHRQAPISLEPLCRTPTTHPDSNTSGDYPHVVHQFSSRHSACSSLSSSHDADAADRSGSGAIGLGGKAYL